MASKIQWPIRLDDAQGSEFLSSVAPELTADDWKSAPDHFLSVMLISARKLDFNCFLISEYCVTPWITSVLAEQLTNGCRLWLRRFIDELVPRKLLRGDCVETVARRAVEDHHQCLKTGAYDADFIALA